MNSARASRLIVSLTAATLLAATLAVPVLADPAPAPVTYGSATVDGNPSEWGSPPPGPIQMYEAGDPEKANPSNAYLRYSCSAQTMYVLVLANAGFKLIDMASAAWGAIPNTANKVYGAADGDSDTDFEWIAADPDTVTIGEDEYNVVSGYEASFPLAVGDYTNFIIHVEFAKPDGSGGWSGGTSANLGFRDSLGTTPLSLECSTSQPSISIVKTTNGSDGPYIPVGGTVTWSYVVTNTGNVDLTTVTVTDDKLADSAIDCGNGSNVIASLAADASATCTASGTATAGAYSNTGTATGTPPVGDNVTDDDPSSYFGSQPSISIVKTTNGSDGPSLWVGDAITWTYVVTNTGNVALTNVTVTDNRGVDIDCDGGTNTTTDHVIASLAVSGSVTCTASGTATAGAYSNTGTATGTPPVGSNVSAGDPSSYTGFTTGLTTPTNTTCQQFRDHLSGSLTEENYLVSKGKIGSIAPGVFFYYSKIVLSTAGSPASFVVKQSNDRSWKTLGVQQAILWDANCVKTSVTPSTNTSGNTTFNTSSLRAGTYYISIKYDPGTVVGTSVTTPYPTVNYMFGTYQGTSTTPYLSSSQTVAFKPKS